MTAGAGIRRGIGMAALLAIGLAACGGDDSGSGATTTAPAAAETTTTASPPETTATTAATGTTAGADQAIDVKVGDTAAGSALVDKDGRSLYLYLPDGTSGASTCTGGCADAWPPAAPAGGTVVAGPGVDAAAEFSVITRDDGSTQIAVNGQPLYLFAGDEAAGDANGQGSGGVWYLLDATGTAIDED